VHDAVSVRLQRTFLAVGHFAGFLWDTARSTRDVRTWLPLTLTQMLRIGVQSVPIALFIAACCSHPMCSRKLRRSTSWGRLWGRRC